MPRYVWHDGEWRETVKAAPRPRLAIIGDKMQAARHPVTGQMVDSKSRAREITRAHGYVELGNDAEAEFSRPREFDATGLEQMVAESAQAWDQGFRPELEQPLEGDMRMISE